jgi:hypothetical protein
MARAPRRMSTRTILLLLAAGFVVVGVVWHFGRWERQLYKSYYDRSSQSYLRALYARIVAYKNEQSRWPAKRNLPSPGIESCVDGDGDPMHRDMIVHYWENCEFLDGKGRQGVLVGARCGTCSKRMGAHTARSTTLGNQPAKSRVRKP